MHPPFLPPLFQTLEENHAKFSQLPPPESTGDGSADSSLSVQGEAVKKEEGVRDGPEGENLGDTNDEETHEEGHKKQNEASSDENGQKKNKSAGKGEEDDSLVVCEIAIPQTQTEYSLGWPSPAHKEVYDWHALSLSVPLSHCYRVKTRFDQWVGGENVDHFTIEKIVYYHSKKDVSLPLPFFCRSSSPLISPFTRTAHCIHGEVCRDARRQCVLHTSLDKARGRGRLHSRCLGMD